MTPQEQKKMAASCKRGYKRALTAAAREYKQMVREDRKAYRVWKAEEAQWLKEEEKFLKVREAEGRLFELPAIVLRDGTVKSVSLTTAAECLEAYAEWMMLDVETSGYWIGHKNYELRTVQLGGEEIALVLDAADEMQMKVAAYGLQIAKKLSAHSAIADVVPCVNAGLIDWDSAWAKMHDSVIYAKLSDPKLSGSEAEGLKDLSRDLLKEYATAPPAEKAKNLLFKAMGCKTGKLTSEDPVTANGWYCVNKNSETMIRYAGSDVLDLAAVIRVLPDPVKSCTPPYPLRNPLSKSEVLDPGSVLERERRTQGMAADIAYRGFPMDTGHVKAKIKENEAERDEHLKNVRVLTDGKVTNPASPDTGAKLIELYPHLELEVSEKTGKPSASKGSLKSVTGKGIEEITAKEILAYRHNVTQLGLLLRPFEDLCDNGDARMRPTVFTINAATGRFSTVRPNIQQLSRQGGIRKCVVAPPGYVMINADFEGCEIRCAAGISGDRQLLEAEMSSKCYKCEDDPCSCGANHTGLHWLSAHKAFGPDAKKENRYKAKAVTFRKLFGGAPEDETAEYIAKVFDEQVAPQYAEWDKWLRSCWYEGSAVWRDYTTGENYRVKHGERRQLVYWAYSGRPMYSTKGAHAAGNCVTPDTLLLTDDMRHVRADEIEVGDKLVTFDMDLPEGKKYRELRRGQVVKTGRAVKDCITVNAGGVSVTCSTDHRWWARLDKEPHRGGRFMWLRADELKPGYELLSLGQPWEHDNSYSSGYVAGMYDGEGSLQARGLGHNATSLLFSQVEGPAMREFVKHFESLGLPGEYRARKQGSTSNTSGIQTTAIRNIMRVLGTVRPTRLLLKAQGLDSSNGTAPGCKGAGTSFYEGMSLTGGACDTAKIESVVPAGKQEVILVETDTHTFVANGLLSHNTAIQGTARELMVDAALEWNEQVRLHPWWEALPLACIHDELLCWVREEYFEEARECMKNAMYSEVLSIPGWKVPIDTDVEKEPHKFWADSS